MTKLDLDDMILARQMEMRDMTDTHSRSWTVGEWLVSIVAVTVCVIVLPVALLLWVIDHLWWSRRE